jgi:transposase
VKYVTPLNETEIQTLYAMHRYHPSRRARMRAHSLLLSHQGVSMPHIARIYQVDRRSVSTWIDRWQTRGFVGFYDQPGAGRRPLLSVAEQHKVHQYLQQYPKDLKRVGHQLEQEPQTRVSTKTIKRFIKKTARSGNGCANHLRNRLIHKNRNAARIELTDFTSVKQLVKVLSGIVMAPAFASPHVSPLHGNR